MKQRKLTEVPETLVQVGHQVIAKHKNSRFRLAKVLEIFTENFYKVTFDDNSWSDNLYQEDLISVDWSRKEPAIGTSVQVKWVDGEVYNATYKGYNGQEMFKIKFEDGHQNDVTKHEFYLMDEKLPKRVENKLDDCLHAFLHETEL